MLVSKFPRLIGGGSLAARRPPPSRERPTRGRCSRAVAERVIRFRVRTILAIFALAIAVWAVLHVASIARSVLVWIAISVFLALAINPLVEWLQRRGIRRRGLATGAAFILVMLGLAAIGALF